MELDLSKFDTSEYFCNHCGQLRLSFKHKADICGNCGSYDLITGETGTLDKDALKKEWAERIKMPNTDLDKTIEKLMEVIQITQERHYQELKPLFDKLTYLRGMRVESYRIDTETAIALINAGILKVDI